METGQNRSLPVALLTEHYEQLRESVLAGKSASAGRGGQAALRARGMATWIQLARESILPLRAACPPTAMEVIPIPPPVQDDLIQLMGEVVLTLVTRESTL